MTCGIGVMHRSVQCLTNDDEASDLCLDDLKPEERRMCHNVHECEGLSKWSEIAETFPLIAILALVPN